jgi:glycosyltransferase involved in cell wall biosynthesis
VILTDDHSTDNSLAIAEKYRDRVTVVRNPSNIGQPRNTNQCVELSQGEYLVILHSDDALLPDFCEQLVPLLDCHPHVGMAVGERLETDETGVPQAITPFYDRNCVVPGEKQAKVFMMAAAVPCQVLVRRKTFFDAGGVHERHIVNLDGLLWFKCALHGDVAYTRMPVCIYRRHGESTTAQYNRTIQHMLEYYGTLCEMFRYGQHRPYLRQHFAAAEKRVGALTVRYCHGVIRERNFELAKRFLSLASVFDPAIIHEQEYRTLRYCVESEQVDRWELYQRLVRESEMTRRTSYPPPEGSTPLEPASAEYERLTA